MFASRLEQFWMIRQVPSDDSFSLAAERKEAMDKLSMSDPFPFHKLIND